MFYGGGTRDKANIALCNVATDYWIGWRLLTTFFQTCSTTAIHLQACWVFLFSYSFFSSSFINSKWAWQRFDNLFLIPTSQVEPTCSASPNSMTLENCNLWQVSQFHEVEAVRKKGGAKVALKCITVSNCLDMKKYLPATLPAWLFRHCWLATRSGQPICAKIASNFEDLGRCLYSL